MKNYTQFVAAIVFSVLALGLSSDMAQAQVATPMTFALSGSGTGSLTGFSLTGSGTITPYGATNVSIVGGTTQTGGSFGISFVITFSNGSTLAANSAAPTNTGTTYAGTATIISGSGQFTGATGSFTYNVVVSVGAGGGFNFTESGSGTIYQVPLTTALADLVAGDIWTTGILEINTANQAKPYTANFFGDSGSAISLPLGGSPVNTATGTLPALGLSYAEASAPSSSVQQGWGQVTKDQSVIVHALFRDHQPNGSYYEAAVPSNPGAKEFLAPFDYTVSTADQQQLATGFAIANMDSTTATITCTARDSSGTVIPNAVQVPALNPLGHWAGFSFPALASLRGTVDCTSNANIAALAVRYYGSATFSSLPVINNPSLTSSNATVGLPDFAVGGIWTTGFFVINTGSQLAPYAISLYSDSGALLPLKFANGTMSVVNGTVPANGSVYFEASDPSGSVQQGWAQVTAGPSVVVHALFRDHQPDGTYYEAAVPSNAGNSKEFLAPFDFTASQAPQVQLATGLAIANLGSQAALVNCTARDSNGNIIANAVQVPTINALGHWSGFNFPLLNGLRGTVDCTSNMNIAGLAVRYFGTQTFSSLPVLAK